MSGQDGKNDRLTSSAVHSLWSKAGSREWIHRLAHSGRPSDSKSYSSHMGGAILTFSTAGTHTRSNDSPSVTGQPRNLDLLSERGLSPLSVLSNGLPQSSVLFWLPRSLPQAPSDLVVPTLAAILVCPTWQLSRDTIPIPDTTVVYWTTTLGYHVLGEIQLLSTDTYIGRPLHDGGYRLHAPSISSAREASRWLFMSDLLS